MFLFVWRKPGPEFVSGIRIQAWIGILLPRVGIHKTEFMTVMVLMIMTNDDDDEFDDCRGLQQEDDDAQPVT
jgi:hypothetical protein